MAKITQIVKDYQRKVLRREKMGFTYVKMGIENPWVRNGIKEVEFLVDTGAIYTIVSTDILKKQGIKPLRKEKFRLANGKIVERSLGEVRFYYQNKSIISPVIFGGKKDKTLLGVVTLESLGLQVDPRTHKLKPAELLLL